MLIRISGLRPYHGWVARRERGITGALLSLQQPRAGTHPASLPSFRPPECPDLTQHFALKISEGFKDSSLDSIQTMFLLDMYTGGGKAGG